VEMHELHDWITTLEQRIVELNAELDELRQLLERRPPGNSVYTALAAQIALFQDDLAATQDDLVYALQERRRLRSGHSVPVAPVVRHVWRPAVGRAARRYGTSE
jgi:hypothetical protein